MYKLIVAIILSCVFTSVQGQDQIITIYDEVIDCKIITITSSKIHYEVRDGKNRVAGRSIPLSEVDEYYRNTQQERLYTDMPYERRWNEPFDRWKIGIQAGGSYLLGSSADAEKEMQEMGVSAATAKEYHKKYRIGMSFGADIHYFINKNIGIGAKYSLFASSLEIDYAMRLPTYNGGFGYIREKENVYVNFFGPSVFLQNPLDRGKKFFICGELSAGYARYRDEERFDRNQVVFITSGNVPVYNLLTQGGAFGGYARLSLEYCPVTWLTINASTAYFLSTFKKVKISYRDRSETIDLDKKDYQDMSRIDYSLGMNFRF